MAKSAKKSTGKKASTTTASKPKSGPPPFTKASDSLQSFLEPLSTEEIYLIHIDSNTIDLKTKTFIVPVVINVLITAVIALRAYMGFYIYPPMLATLLGLSTSAAVDPSVTSMGQTVSIVVQRTANLLFDYLLVTIFLAWPVRFVLGPVKWRRAVGFRDREIIVRRSQSGWSQNLVRNNWIRDDEEARNKVVAAMTPDRIQKTGYLLVDADWDLDYDAMIRAHELVDRTRKGQRVPLDEFRTVILVNTDTNGWLVWHIRDGFGANSQREQILAFKDKLTDMGKEDLFFRWVEIIQYESTRPGGFTPERQYAAMSQAKKLFEDNDVDFSRFWREVGGMNGLPGFEE